MRGLRPACPALSARRHCPLSRCQRMAIVILSAHQAATADMQAAPPCSGRILPQQTPVMLAALNPTRTRWTGHLGKPTACPRTTRCRTSCGPPEVAAGIGLGAMFGCVRHCRRDHAHGGAAGKPRAWHQYPNRIQRRGDPLSTVGQYQVGKNFCDRWQSAPYAHALWSVWRSQRPAPVLRVVLYYAHRMINERT